MKMKAQEIHGMTNDELATKLSDLKDELFNLHFRRKSDRHQDDQEGYRENQDGNPRERTQSERIIGGTEDGKKFKKRESRNSYVRQDG